MDSREVGPVSGAQPIRQPAVTGKQVAGVVALSIALAAIGAVGLYFLHLQRGLGNLAGRLAIGGAATVVAIPGAALALKGLISTGGKKKQLEVEGVTLVSPAKTELGEDWAQEIKGLNSKISEKEVPGLDQLYRGTVRKQVYDDSTGTLTHLAIENRENPGTYQLVRSEAGGDSEKATRQLVTILKGMLNDDAEVEQALIFLTQTTAGSYLESLEVPYLVQGTVAPQNLDQRIRAGANRANQAQQRVAEQGRVFRVGLNEATNKFVIRYDHVFGYAKEEQVFYHGTSLQYDTGSGTGFASIAEASVSPDVLDLSDITDFYKA